MSHIRNLPCLNIYQIAIFYFTTSTTVRDWRYCQLASNGYNLGIWFLRSWQWHMSTGVIDNMVNYDIYENCDQTYTINLVSYWLA